MATSLLDHLRSVFTSPAVTDLAEAIGQSTAPTQKALDALLPALTAGVVHQSQTPTGAATLHRLVTTTPFATDPSLVQLAQTDAHRQQAAESGNRLLGQLVPDHPQRLAEQVAPYSGISLGAATTLTGLVMSVLMGYLHQQVTSRSLTQAQLAALLTSEPDTATSALPVALLGGLGWLLGTSVSQPLTTPVTPIAPIPTRRDELDTKATGFPTWLRWVLIGLGLLLLLWLLLRSCQGEKPAAQRLDEAVPVATDTVASDLDGNELATKDSTSGPEVRVGVDLPGGRRLSVVERSFTYSLAQYLAAKNQQTPKVFTFDNLTFETDSARITAKARPSVADLIQIMQAYPNLAIRIEGNTDSTGDDAINDPLSAERAEVVKRTLLKAGIQANRVTTRERGDTKPVASNQTVAGRQMNRRIDIVVTKI